ncbi:MAG: thioredoxin domain-containing protein [Acidobacteria bacterium]|nr:thioredoxin domain-containing protein [Acidobacteriota bacterium]
MGSQTPQGSKKYLPFVIIGVVLLAVVAAAYMMLRSNGSDTTAQTDNTSRSAAGVGSSGASNIAQGNASSAAPPVVPPRRAGSPGAQPPHAKGSESAPVVLEEFGDYQCPPCGNLHPVLQKIEDDYGERVRVVFRNYPLQQMHKNAFTAARAAEAAALQGKFWQMHDMIYEGQKQWSESPEPRPIFNSYASRIELDVEKFKADMEHSTVTSRIIADFERGGSLGVKGTPTIFLNGRELTVEKTLSESKLRAEIDAALAGKNQ